MDNSESYKIKKNEYVKIIPCLDMKDGRVVKGVRFEGIRDVGDPAEAAGLYCGAGADELVLLDINASYEGRPTLIDVVARTAKQATVPFCVGGGISTAEQARELIGSGADKVSINSPAVKNPGLIEDIAARFGSASLIVAIDAKKSGDNYWEVYLNGGRAPTGKEVVEWAREIEGRGAGAIMLNSIDMDGVRQGYDLEITRRVADAVKIPVIASGGAGSLKDFADAVTEGHADALLAASLFHFRQLEIMQVKEYLHGLGIPVRL